MEKHYPTSEYDEKNPTEVFEIFWLMAFRKVGEYPNGKLNIGKWLIFVDNNKIDNLWKIIKEATENGLLGNCSKVSTAKPNTNSTNTNQSVICVYTYDYEDETDLRKIREELRKLGIEKKIPYKSDTKTRQGEYKVNRDSKIGNFFE